MEEEEVLEDPMIDRVKFVVPGHPHQQQLVH